MRNVALGLAALLLTAAVPCLADGPQFVADLGAGNVPSQTIGMYTPWYAVSSEKVGVSLEKYIDSLHPMSKELFIKFKSYKVTYKIWSMFGEPVFDFLFRWDGAMEVGHLECWDDILKWGVSPDELHGLYSTLSAIHLYDADLQERFKKVRPLSVSFRIALSNKSFYSRVNQYEYGPPWPGAGNAFGPKGAKATGEDTNILMQPLSEPVFYVDLPAAEGVWQDFSVPGSPDWSALPKYFKLVMKKRENPADLFITNIEISEIRWPQYELMSIVREQYDRQVLARQKIIADQEDFWNRSVRKSDLPAAPVADSRRQADAVPPSFTEQQKARQGRYKALQAAALNPVALAEPELNKLSVSVCTPLQGAVLVLRDAKGASMGTGAGGGIDNGHHCHAGSGPYRRAEGRGRHGHDPLGLSCRGANPEGYRRRRRRHRQCPQGFHHGR